MTKTTKKTARAEGRASATGLVETAMDLLESEEGRGEYGQAALCALAGAMQALDSAAPPRQVAALVDAAFWLLMAAAERDGGNGVCAAAGVVELLSDRLGVQARR